MLSCLRVKSTLTKLKFQKPASLIATRSKNCTPAEFPELPSRLHFNTCAIDLFCRLVCSHMRGECGFNFFIICGKIHYPVSCSVCGLFFALARPFGLGTHADEKPKKQLPKASDESTLYNLVTPSTFAPHSSTHYLCVWHIRGVKLHSVVCLSSQSEKRCTHKEKSPTYDFFTVFNALQSESSLMIEMRLLRHVKHDSVFGRIFRFREIIFWRADEER